MTSLGCSYVRVSRSLLHILARLQPCAGPVDNLPRVQTQRTRSPQCSSLLFLAQPTGDSCSFSDSRLTQRQQGRQEAKRRVWKMQIEPTRSPMPSSRRSYEAAAWRAAAFGCISLDPRDDGGQRCSAGLFAAPGHHRPPSGCACRFSPFRSILTHLPNMRSGMEHNGTPWQHLYSCASNYTGSTWSTVVPQCSRRPCTCPTEARPIANGQILMTAADSITLVSHSSNLWLIGLVSSLPPVPIPGCRLFLRKDTFARCGPGW